MTSKNPHLLTPAEVAAVFAVDPKTVTRWDKDGRLPDGACVRTPGGHRRFSRAVMNEKYPGLFPPVDGGAS